MNKEDIKLLVNTTLKIKDFLRVLGLMHLNRSGSSDDNLSKDSDFKTKEEHKNGFLSMMENYNRFERISRQYNKVGPILKKQIWDMLLRNLETHLIIKSKDQNDFMEFKLVKMILSCCLIISMEEKHFKELFEIKCKEIGINILN